MVVPRAVMRSFLFKLNPFIFALFFMEILFGVGCRMPYDVLSYDTNTNSTVDRDIIVRSTAKHNIVNNYHNIICKSTNFASNRDHSAGTANLLVL